MSILKTENRRLKTEIAILGGGVSGVTTGVVLQLLGFRTRLYTARRLDEAVGDPAVASHWAAASCIPHSVRMPEPAFHTRRTQRAFEVLRRSRRVGGGFGVRRQRHYEVFEQPTPPPAYAAAMPRFRRLPSDGSGVPGAPRRQGAEGIYGWHFDVHFVDMPVYRARLCMLYEAAGGAFVRRRLTRADLTALPGAALVNCLGLGALDLFDDPAPHRLLRGRLVRVEGLRARPHRRTGRRTGRRFSYTYVPGPGIYRMTDGTAADLYCYPRRADVVLGGTREAGTLEDGQWRGASYDGPTVQIGGEAVPRALVDLNRQLLRDLTGADLMSYPKRVLTGYRFVRDPVRLEATEEEGRPVVHNYGHGGAGIALSWSCALEVARLLRTRAVSNEPPGATYKASALSRLLRSAV